MGQPENTMPLQLVRWQKYTNLHVHNDWHKMQLSNALTLSVSIKSVLVLDRMGKFQINVSNLLQQHLMQVLLMYSFKFNISEFISAHIMNMMQLKQ